MEKSLEESLISGRAVIFHHVSSGWVAYKGDNKISQVHVSYNKSKKKYFLLAIAEDNNEIQFKFEFFPKCLYSAVASQPLFHQVYDKKKFWGLNFVNKETADSFLSFMNELMKDPEKKPQKVVKSNTLKHITTSAQTIQRSKSVGSTQKSSALVNKNLSKSNPTSPLSSVNSNKTNDTKPTQKCIPVQKSDAGRPVTSLAKRNPSSLSPRNMADKPVREKIIDEILKTELDYVDALDILSTMYYYPLKYAPRLGLNIFKPGDFERIFYGFSTIHLLNKELLQELKMKNSNKSLYNECGKVLNMFAPSMKLYIDYVNNYDNTIALIKEYEETNENFKKFLQINMEDIECQLRGLKDFLIMPIQRIPRYVLLLQQLKSKTDSKHGDYSEICKALETFESIANYINNQKKDYDQKEKVAKIQQRMNPKSIPMMKEGRYLILEGIVYTKNELFIPPKKNIKQKPNKPPPPPEQLGLKELELFLMNDLILCAEKDPKYGYLNEVFRIDLWDIVDCEEREQYQVPFYSIDGSMYKSFILRTHQSSKQPEIPIMYVANSVDYENWVLTISQKFPEAAEKKAKELDRIAKAKVV